MKDNKYFSVILAYAIVLAVAVASMVLMFVVGAPEIVFILQIVGIVLNVAQIGLYVWHAIKSARGEPAPGLGRAILGVNIGWVFLTALNFILASVGAYLRWDLAVVWVCQLVTVLLVYKMWSKIEYRVALKNYAAEKKDAKTGKTRYLVFVVIVLIIQIVSIALPASIMSTKFRNEGLKYRNIMYESSEDGKEYYVKGVYWGSSKSVFIPAEFNGRKVTKILDGAIDSETVWNKLFTSSKEIEKVTFEDTEEHPSNIREIGARAIVGNNITEIKLPSSVVSIGQEAVVSDNLKKVELYAQNGNVYFGTSIVTPVLETLSISATSDAVIVFEDDFRKEGLNVTIVNDNEDKSDTDKVQEKYNYIRENYPEIREGLTVENVEKKAIVNFETNLNGLFIPTKILDLVSGVAELRTSMLEDLWTSSNAFIKNKTFFNPDLIFTDSVTGLRYLFRGWENEFGKLVVFDSDTYSALFNKDTTLYARWAKVCNVTYDWGEYFVPVETTAVEREFVVGEEENNFLLPTYDRYNRAGYRDLKWYCMDESDETHYSLSTNYLTTAFFTDSVVLTPVWEMDYMQVVPALVYETGDDNLREELNSTSKVFTFDKENRLITTYSIHHPLNKTNYYTVNWSFEPSQYAAENGATAQNGSFELQYNSAARGNCVMSNVRNLSTVFTCEFDNEKDCVCFTFVATQVLESGTYSVVVNAQSANPEAVETVSAGSSNVTLSVEPKDLNLDKTDLDRIIGENGVIFLENNSIIYDGQGHSIFAQANPDAPIAFDNYSGNGEHEVGTYVVSVRMTVLAAAGSDKVNPNYLPATISSQYTISKTQVQVRWKLDGVDSSVGPFTKVYDGQAHKMVAVYGDNVPDEIRYVKLDSGEYQLDDKGQRVENTIPLVGEIERTDCGTYSVRIANLTGEESYEYDFSDGPESVEWTITPRPVEITWQNTDVTYNGEQQVATASVKLCARANESCPVTYKPGSNVAVNAGTYTAEVQSISNPNYTLEGGVGLSRTWKVKKLPVQVLWESVLTSDYIGDVIHTTYNAQEQTLRAIATNACISVLTNSKDAIEFTYAGCIRGGILNANTVKFRNAGDYTMSIIGIKGDAADNYTIESLSVGDHTNTAKNCDWTIDKKVLTKDWKEEKQVEYSADFVNGITYDGKKHTYVLEVNGFEGEDVKSVVAGNFTVPLSERIFTLTGKYTEENNALYTLELTALDAGVYTMDVSVDLPNYVLAANTGSDLKTLTVSPAAVRFNWYLDEACTEEYTTSVVYRGTNYQLYAQAVATDLFMNEKTSAKDTVKAELEDNVKKNAGNYLAKITKIDNANYVIAQGHTTKSWSILRATLTVTSNTDVNVVYGGDVKTAYLRISGFVSGEETAMPMADKEPVTALSLSISGTTGARLVGSSNEAGAYDVTLQGVNAGTYTLMITGLKSSYLTLTMNNYSLAATESVTLSISPLVISLQWNAADHAAYEYNGNNRIVSASIANVRSNVWNDPQADTPKLSYTEGKGTTQRNADEYVTEVCAVDDPNYTLVGTNDLVRNWKITKRTLTKTDESWSGLENTYDRQEKKAVLTIANVAKSDCVNSWKNKFTVETTPSLAYSFSYYVDPDDENANYVKFTFAYTNAASFDIVITCNDANYNAVSWNGTFGIAKKVLTLSWSGSDLVYDGAEHQNAYVATPTNVENGDSIAFTYSYSGNCKDVDTYQTTVTGFTGTGSANYTIEGTSGKVKIWNITKRTLGNFVWKNDSGVTYQSAYVYNGNKRSVTAVAGNAVDTVTFTYSNNTATNASDVSYTAEITGIEGDPNNKNYALPVVTARRKDWRIERAPLTVKDKTEGVSYTYNALTRSIKVFELSGLINDDLSASNFTPNAGSLSVSSFTYDTTTNETYAVYVSAKDAGDYTVSLSAVLADTNYRMAQGTSLSTSFLIAKKDLTVTWQDLNTTYIYSNEQKTFRIAVGGVEGGEEGVYTITGNKQMDAGSYTATVTINNSNYKFAANTTASRIWTIQKRVLSEFVWSLTGASAGAYNVTYDRAVHTVSATASNAIGEVLFTYTANASSTNAGEYKTVITGIVGEANNKNYALPESEVALNWTIKKAPLTVTWYDLQTSYTYNSQPQEYRVGVSGDIEGDTNVYTISGNVQTNAGTYTALVTINNTTNYAFADGMVASRDWTIAKAPLTVTWTDFDAETPYTYNRSAQTYRIKVDGEKGSDANVYTITGNVQTNAGTYSAFVSINNTNYRIDNESVDARSWTIKQKDINVVWTDYVAESNYTYTSSSQEYRIAVSGDIAGDNGVYSVTGNVQTNAGTYTATVAIHDTNYKFANNTVTSRNWTIAKAPLTVTWTDFDAETSYTYNGTAQTYHISVYGELGSDTGVYSVTGNVRTDAGNETATVVINNVNYKFKDGSVTTRNWSILPKPITVNNVDLGTVTYDGSEKTFTLALSDVIPTDLDMIRNNASITLPNNVTMSAASSSIVYQDNKLKLSFKATNAGSYANDNAGKYTIQVNSLYNDNYSISGNGIAFFKVEKYAIAYDAITLENAAYEYNGEEKKPVVLFDGRKLDGATYTGSTKATNVNAYTMTLTGLNNNNYMLESAFTKDLTWTISKFTLTVTAPEVNTFLYNGVDITYDITVSALPQADAARTVYTISDNVKVDVASKYTAVVTLADTVNYILEDSVSEETGTSLSYDWFITKRTLTVTKPQSDTFTYNGADQSYDVGVKGLAAADVGKNKYTIANDKNATRNVGSYTTTVSLNDTVNYELEDNDTNHATSLSYNWSITKYTLTVTAPSVYSFTYNGVDITYDITVGDLAQHETESVYTISNKTKKDVAEKYTATVMLADTVNYILEDSVSKETGTSLSYDWFITKRTLTVTKPQSDTFTYNGADQSYDVGVLGLAAADVGKNKYTIENDKNATRNVGSYTTTVSLNDTVNYELEDNNTNHATSLSYNWSITKAQLIVKWADEKTLTYNGANQTYGVEVGNVQNHEANVYTVTGNVQKDAKLAPEKYTATVTINDTANYEFADGAVTSMDWNIAKKVLSITTPAVNAYTYNGQDRSYDLSVKDVAVYETKNVYSITNSAASTKNVGSYSTTVTLLDTVNYAFANTEEVTLNYAWSVTPSEVSGVTFSESNNTSFTYKQQNAKVVLSWKSGVFGALSFSGKVSVTGGDGVVVTATGSTATVNFAGADAGTYTISVAPFNVDNHKLSTTQSLTITINKKELTASVAENRRNLSTTDLIYNNTAQTCDVTVVVADTQNAPEESDVFTILNDTNIATTAGVHTAIVKINNNNYIFKDKDDETKKTQVALNWYISKKALAVTPAAMNTIAYNGANREYKIDVSDVASGDDYRDIYTIADNQKVAAGSYTATVTLKETDNYKFLGAGDATVLSYNWRITKKTLTVTLPGSNSFTYVKNTVQEYSVTVSGVATNDTASEVYAITGTTSATDAGSYTVKVTIQGGMQGNYEFAGEGNKISRDYTWTIKPCIATLMINGTEYNEGDIVDVLYDSSNELSYAFYVNGERDDDVSGIPSKKQTSDTTYTSTFTLNKNYCLASDSTEPKIAISVYWNVVPSRLTVDFSDLNHTYDGQPSHPTITITDQEGHIQDALGNYYYDMCYVTCGSDSYDDINAFVRTDRGNYAFEVHLKADYATNAQHYSFVSDTTSETFTISPKPIRLEMEAKTYVYNNSAQSVAFKLYDVANEVYIHPDLLPAGELTLPSSEKDAGNNYTAVFSWKNRSNYCFAKPLENSGITLWPNKAGAEVEWTIAPKNLTYTDLTLQYRGNGEDEWKDWYDTTKVYYNGTDGYQFRIVYGEDAEIFKCNNVYEYTCGTNVTMSWMLKNTNYTYNGSGYNTEYVWSLGDMIQNVVLNVQDLAGKSFSDPVDIKRALTDNERLWPLFSVKAKESGQDLGQVQGTGEITIRIATSNTCLVFPDNGNEVTINWTGPTGSNN